MAAARQFCDAAKSKSLSACFRTAFIRRSPTMKPRDARTSIDCHRNYERAVALFPYSRVSTTVSRVASQFCRKKQYTTTLSLSFPRLSNYLFSHRHLSPPPYNIPALTLSPFPFPSLPHTYTYKPPSSTLLPSFTPLYTPPFPLHRSLSLSLFIVRSLDSISLLLALE